MSTVISVENLSKSYRLGTISRTTFYEDLTRWLRPPRRKSSQLTNRDYPNFGESIWALRDVSFEVQNGDTLGIIGRNGAGKSTLLKILSKVTAPTSGEARLKGRVASLLEVGTGFHPELTGRENVQLNGELLGMSRSEVASKFDEIVSFAEIEKFMDTPVKRYSSGMYVRLAFAIAAHLEPEILIVDEVLAVGDAAFQRKCLGKMSDDTKQGRTVLFVSHNMAAVQRLCNRAILLEDGRIASDGDVTSVIDKYYETDIQKIDGEQTEGDTDKPVLFRACHINDSRFGDSAYVFSGDQCALRLELVVRQDVKAATFGIAIWTTDGILVWASRSIDNGGLPAVLTKGLYEVEFLIEKLVVKPGSYNATISVNDVTKGTLAEWVARPKLQILPRNETGLPPEWQGILNVPGRFKLSLISSDISKVGTLRNG
jgi:lipopolysaccharide transport system ATP-binding protein